MEKIPSNNEKPNDVVRTLVTENYTSIESGSVEVKSAIFTIENNNEKPYIDSDILFLPGWGLNAHDETVKSFCEHIVRINKKNAHAVTTKSLDMVDSSENGIQNLENEMSAVRDYIKKHQFKKIILFGHSQGGDKAMILTHLLQQDIATKDVVCGLVLISSTGLYEQSEQDQVKKFNKDFLVTTPLETLRSRKQTHVVSSEVRMTMEVLGNIIDGVAHEPIGYFKRLKKEVSEMSKRNPYLTTINVPIVIISSSKDDIVNIEKATEGNEGMERTKFLEENVFPNSPAVRFADARRYADHHYTLYARSKATISAALRLLKNNIL